MKKNDLKQKIVVITGASSGIGKATALAYAREGANLVLASRSETLLQELASECEALGANATAVMTDVTNKESVKHLFQTALTFFGGVDIWINNAGVGAVGELEATPIEVHEQVIKTNLLSSLFSAHIVVPYFKRRNKGTIIHMNSTGAFVGAPYSVAYSASKFGLRGLSEAIHYELKEYKDIHICDVYASFVDSPGMNHAANYAGKEVKPAPPLVDPKKIAQVMVRLATHPKRTVHLGSSDRLARLGHALFPELTGRIMNKVERVYFNKAKEVPKTEGNLFKPNYEERANVHGDFS